MEAPTCCRPAATASSWPSPAPPLTGASLSCPRLLHVLRRSSASPRSSSGRSCTSSGGCRSSPPALCWRCRCWRPAGLRRRCWAGKRAPWGRSGPAWWRRDRCGYSRRALEGSKGSSDGGGWAAGGWWWRALAARTTASKGLRGRWWLLPLDDAWQGSHAHATATSQRTRPLLCMVRAGRAGGQHCTGRTYSAPPYPSRHPRSLPTCSRRLATPPPPSPHTHTSPPTSGPTCHLLLPPLPIPGSASPSPVLDSFPGGADFLLLPLLLSLRRPPNPHPSPPPRAALT